MDDVGLSSAESVTRAEHADGLHAYQETGQALAQEIGNRGPLRLTDEGKLHLEILARFRGHGYYVLRPLSVLQKLKNCAATRMI